MGVKEKEKETATERDFYLGKPDLPPSWQGGGWGGPKEGHDKDERFMLRGEARELPDYLYKSWEERGRVQNIIEEKMVGRVCYNSKLIGQAPPSPDEEDESSEDLVKRRKRKGKKKKAKRKKDKKAKKKNTE